MTSIFSSSEDLYLITSFLGMDSQTYMPTFQKARIGPHCGCVTFSQISLILAENGPIQEITINQEKVKYILSVLMVILKSIG